MADYVIRKAKIKDIPALDKLLYEVHKVHSDIRPDLFRAGAKKYTDDELIKILTDETTPVFVYDDGEIQGYAFTVIIDHKNDLSLMPYKSVYIDDLCVEKDCRGKGVGKKLYEYVLSFAKSINAYNVTLNVWAGNDSISVDESLCRCCLLSVVIRASSMYDTFMLLFLR